MDIQTIIFFFFFEDEGDFGFGTLFHDDMGYWRLRQPKTMYRLYMYMPQTIPMFRLYM